MDPKEKEEIGQPSDGGAFLAEEHPEQITIAEGDWRNKLDGPLQTLYVEWQEDPAYAAANPNSGRGENCIVAIVDSGVDITHEMFAKKKILKVWDQAARKVAGSHVKYGCVYSNFPKGYERPLAEYEGDPDGHGTHVAGTACHL
uniref:Peptidase S8/S53 domain-containing protein n=1 Tax=Paramoeba aestuarina TaxID=180227 RepID=A0A7S4KVW0_9EUKA|mmetsp:Transcript_26025/g.40601  ORF Transcript_26025/g.40601 Transcript_26025/m.40601 type:complete len:144 (+) Transcript_26025:53-484(+)